VTFARSSYVRKYPAKISAFAGMAKHATFARGSNNKKIIGLVSKIGFLSAVSALCGEGKSFFNA
jgi:hypothetical protein